jgi:hypothetical protein
MPLSGLPSVAAVGAFLVISGLAFLPIFLTGALGDDHHMEILRYEVTWNGQKAAHGDITTKRDGADMHVSVQAVSDGVLKSMIELWSKVQAGFHAKTFRPQWYTFQLKSNLLPAELVNLTFDHKSGLVTVDKQKGEERENHQEQYQSAYDPITAAFLLRSQPRFEKALRVDVYDGKDRARLFVTPHTTGPLTVKGGTFQALGLDLKMVKLTGDKKELGKARLWMSDDSRRIPLLLTSNPIVGTIRFELLQAGGPPRGNPS